MVARVLITVSAVAALLGAAPALAEQPDREPERQKHPGCCERYEAQIRALTARVGAAEANAAGAAREPSPPSIERHSVLDESW